MKQKPNPHLIGMALKDMVRRAIWIARSQVSVFEVTGKEGYGGNMDDVFTSADTKAQQSYVKLLQECFPGLGILGEEDSLVVAAAPGETAYFTVDPLDGTKAYIRRQSHGVGSMISLVDGEVVESAYIGDVNTKEIFGYRPDSDSAWRITGHELFERLENKPEDVPFCHSYLLLRERECDYSALSRKTTDLFRSVSIDGGSIGIWAARLWKREVVGLLINPSWVTPWDSSPVVGISKKLGYVFLKPSKGTWEIFEPVVSREKYYRDHDTLIIHRNQLDQLTKLIPVTC